MTEYKYPAEEISLPSKGLLYPKDSPLSSGQVELKYMRSREEDILTSRNLIQKGVVIDHLLRSLLVNKDIDLNDMLVGDKNAIMVAARVLGYGGEYNVDVTCPACTTHNKVETNLSKLDHKAVDFSQFEGETNSFEFTLPSSKRDITFKLLTQADENSIDEDVIALRKVSKDVSPELSTRLKHTITSVDGSSTRKDINSFVDNELLSRDSLALRQHITSITPDVDMSFDFTCEQCGHDEEVDIPLTAEFFWPAGRR